MQALGMDAGILEANSDSFLKPAESAEPYLLVLGNAKGGCGKTTTAVHLAVALLRQGYRVGCLDLDARQRTLTSYIVNRERFARRRGWSLDMPLSGHVDPPADGSGDGEGDAPDVGARLRTAFEAVAGCQFVVVDTPGNDSRLNRLAHLNADTLITPLNDSFLDLDVIARVDSEDRAVLGPSFYTQMVWEQSNRRVLAGRGPVDWIVIRNRLSHIEARNKRDIAALLQQLAGRIGFRLAPGFGERVVFRELFLKGLTLLDVLSEGELRDSPSHTGARAEVAGLLEAIGLTGELPVDRAPG